jgi:MFS transporter, Spinster family, sphingosine-1-phosphate transporter
LIYDLKPGAYSALALLLGINLFNYIDRYVLAAVEPKIRSAFFAPGDPNAMAVSGLLGTAFFVTYMLSAPTLGWLSDRFSHWVVVGTAVHSPESGKRRIGARRDRFLRRHG